MFEKMQGGIFNDSLTFWDLKLYVMANKLHCTL